MTFAPSDYEGEKKKDARIAKIAFGSGQGPFSLEPWRGGLLGGNTESGPVIFCDMAF